MSQLIAIDPQALEALCDEVSRLHKRLDAVQMIPRPEWVTVEEFAKLIDRHPRTVKRRIKAGEVETREIAGVCMVRVNLGA